MTFTVTLKIDAKELKEWHADMDAEERAEAVRTDLDEAIEGLSLAYITEVLVTAGKPPKDDEEA
jgi:hypothetical protein